MRIQLTGPTGVAFAKIGCSTVDGGSDSYTKQADLPSELHALAQRAFAPAPAPSAAAAAVGVPRGGGVSGYAFSLAFPFFELWSPARTDLLLVIGVLLAVDAGLCVLCLEPWACAGALLSLSAAVGLLLLLPGRCDANTQTRKHTGG